MRTLVVIFVAVLSANLLGQTTDADLFTVKGEIRDKQDRVIPGLRLEFRDHETRFSGTTDINGRFAVSVSKGDFEVTAYEIPPEDFRLFLKIVDGPMNPGFLELKANSENLCSTWLSKNPKMKNVVKPKPPHGVRVLGEVSVQVTIDPTGKVLTARPISGHPLLRVPTQKAAEQSMFESSDKAEPRSAMVTYTFLDQETERPALKRLVMPCKIVINTEPVLLTVSETE